VTTPKRKVSREKERLERYIYALQAAGRFSPLEREYQFHPQRKWRFDWAVWSNGHRIAIEYEGGVFIGGGHTRGLIYGQNCEKYNTAALMGWTVLRFTAPMIRAGMHETMIAKALE
jgi:hypothetical protein